MGIEVLPISPFQCWEEIGSDGSGESLELTSDYATRYEWQTERAGVWYGSPRAETQARFTTDHTRRGTPQHQAGQA